MSDNINAQDILDSISEEHADDVSEADITAEIESFEQFGVSGNELRNGVLSKVAQSVGVTVDELTGGDDGNGGGSGSGPAPLTDIADIDTAEEWVTLEAEVVTLWDNDHESISQVGLLDDGTNRIKFTAWAKSDVMLLNEGEQYRFENVVTDEYQGNMSVKLNSSTDVSFLDEEKDISSASEVEGAFVALQSGSGLIKRCSEDDCTRTLGKNDRCSEHGEVDGERDLRIKGVLDDGHQCYNVIVNDHDLIETLTGIDLDEAKQMAMDALDTEVVADEMEPSLIGKYFRVEGARIGDFTAVDSMEQTFDRPDTSDLLVKARSL
jgi:replication factor A1